MGYIPLIFRKSFSNIPLHSEQGQNNNFIEKEKKMRRSKSILMRLLVIGMLTITSKAATLSEDFDDGLSPKCWEIFSANASYAP